MYQEAANLTGNILFFKHTQTQSGKKRSPKEATENQVAWMIILVRLSLNHSPNENSKKDGCLGRSKKITIDLKLQTASLLTNHLRL